MTIRPTRGRIRENGLTTPQVLAIVGGIVVVGMIVLALVVKSAVSSALSGVDPSGLSEEVLGLDVELRELRHDHQTAIFLEADEPKDPPTPPEGMFELVRYPAPLGENLAYVTPAGEEPGPAILWVIGGLWFGLEDTPWTYTDERNQQSAQAFREAGITTMFASLRGTMGNPGNPECFFGEVDDLVAAGEWLAARPDVDPERVYIGGHSSGGALVLLVAESTDLFAGAIALGPVADPMSLGERGCLPPDTSDLEAQVRAPIDWVSQIRIPTLIIEGTGGGGGRTLPLFEQEKGDAPVRVLGSPIDDHFTLIAPVTRVAAARIVDGRDPTELTLAEIE
ncbi:MAG: alpha/beta fold hydrolase [Deltaproteobacteria bacterium]|nr:alpha/beta fold hydrolase [Deltaproteobacteria bacterium]